MLTRSQIRRLLVELLVVILVSIFLIVTGVFMSMDKEEIRLQKNYKNMFGDIVPADSYAELNFDMIDSTEGINHVFIAYSEAGEIVGYVADVTVTNISGKQLHSLFGVSDDGLKITGYKRVGDESNPIELTADELAVLSEQVVNKPMPVALSANENEEIVITSEYDPPSGLTDGVYYAQSLTLDSKGYIDYVEIEIENGRIKRVKWDGLNIDPTTGSRDQASLTGAYVISGKNWATQSYNICHALIELQDVSRLAMKSDGRTEIIPDVTCNISLFVELAEECLSNSKVGFTKEDYLLELENLIIKDGGDIYSVKNSDGFMVYPFENTDVFKREGSDSLYNRLTVYETTLTKGELDEFEEFIEDDASQPVIATPIPSMPVTDNHNGAEDGIVSDSSQSIITDSVDGIPMAEINNFIAGIPNGSKRAAYYVTAVNYTYRFFVDYMNWIA